MRKQGLENWTFSRQIGDKKNGKKTLRNLFITFEYMGGNPGFRRVNKKTTIIKSEYERTTWIYVSDNVLKRDTWNYSF